MAYSTQGSTTVSITNFGAKGDGVNNDTNAFQSAIESLYSRGGGSIFVPKGEYLTSGYINVTGHNIQIEGEPGLSWLKTSPSGDFRKLNVSGASGFSIQGMSIHAGRTSGTVEQYVGTVNLFSAPYFRMDNCFIGHTEGLGIKIGGNTYCGTINNNRFEDFHIGLYADSSDTPGISYNRITVSNNTIVSSWGQPQQNYFGGLKFQNIGGEYDGTVPARSYGHEIFGNHISGSSQMGIELFGYICDSFISNNYIEGTQFGISVAASSFGTTVSDNIIKAALSYGIEVADSQNVSVIGNIVEGATGNNYINGAAQNSYATTSGICVTEIGIIANGVGRRPNFYNIVGNVVSDCFSSNIRAYVCDYANIVGNTLVNRAQFPGQSFNDTSSSNIKFSENKMIQISTGSYFVFIDSSSQPCSGLIVSDNQFAGNVNQWGILYYNNNNPASNSTDVLIQNNDTTSVKYCQYGMVNASNYPPIRTLHQNNYGPTGGLGYSIVDGEIPNGSTAYQPSSIENGLQYYGNTTWPVPASGVTGDGIWLCVWSGGLGQQNNVRVRVKNNSDINASNYNDIELWATMAPYQSSFLTNTLLATPTIWDSPLIKQAKTLAHDSSAITNSIWVKIAPVSSGVAGLPFYINYSKENLLGSPYATYTEPPDTTRNAKLVFESARPFPSAYKFGGGINVGQSGAVHLNTYRSGVLSLYDPSSYTDGPELSFGTRIANTTIALYDDLVGPTVYGMGIAPFQMRFHVDQPASRFGFFDSAGGNEVFTVEGVGQVGINVPSPSFNLHVNGTVGLSGIATSYTADSGSAVLPPNPVGFISINITGGNFKVPYYNI